MGAAGNLRPDKRILCPKDICVHGFQCVAPQIVVAVPRSAQQTCLADTCLLHGPDHLELVVLCRLVNLPEPFPEG